MIDFAYLTPLNVSLNGVRTGFYGNGSTVFFVYYSNSLQQTSPPGFNGFDWNYYTISYGNGKASLYINGILRISFNTSAINQNLISNFLGQSQAPNADAKTVGEWRDLVIYKKSLDTNTLNDVMNGIIYNDSLFYYLPFTQAKLGDSNIINNTIVRNSSNWVGALNQSSRINSSADTSAAYAYDSNFRVVTGTYKDSLVNNDSLFLLLNNTLSNNPVNFAKSGIPNLFYANLPDNFLVGKISIYNKELPQRNFNSIWYTPLLRYNRNLWYFLSNQMASDTNYYLYSNSNILNNSGYTFTTINSLPNGLGINSLNGNLSANSNLPDTNLSLTVSVSPSLSTNTVTVNLIKTTDNNPFIYTPDSIMINAGSKDSSILPINQSIFKTYYALDSSQQGLQISIDSISGRIYFGNYILPGKYTIKVSGRRFPNNFKVYTYYYLTILPISLPLKLSQKSATFYLIDTTRLNISSSVSNYGGDSVQSLRYRLVRQPLGVTIDSLSGLVTIKNLKYARYDSFIIKVNNSANEFGYDTFRFWVVSPPDSTSISYGQVFKTKTETRGNSGGYIQLPSLDLRGKFTIAMWMKLDGNIGNWRRIFDFGVGANNQGALIGFPTSTQIGWVVNSVAKSINSPNGFEPKNWNHYAIIFSDTLALLYLNGVQVSTITTSGIQQQLLTSNLLARSNFNDSSAVGRWRDVRIYKKSLDSSTLNDVMNGLNFTDSLYYYLPLTNNNYLDSNIKNLFTIANSSTWSGALTNSSFIVSSSDTSAAFVFDTNYRVINGTYRDTINSNDSFLVKLNNNFANYSVSYPLSNIPNQFFINLPTNFNIGKISINNKQTPFRNFNSVWFTPRLLYNQKQLYLNDKLQDTVLPNLNPEPNTDYLFSSLNELPSGIRLDNVTGKVYIDSILSNGTYYINVGINRSLVANTYSFYVIKGQDTARILYPTDSIVLNFGNKGSSGEIKTFSLTPILYYYLDSPQNFSGVHIDSTTGSLNFDSTLLVGSYLIKVGARRLNRNPNLFTYYTLKVNSIQPTIVFSKPKNIFYLNTSSTLQPMIYAGGVPSSSLRFRLNNPPSGISVDSLSGIISAKNFITPRTMDSFTLFVTNAKGQFSSTTQKFSVLSTLDTVFNHRLGTINLSSNGDYISLPTLNVAANFTIETWFKLSGNQSPNQRIFDLGSSSSKSEISIGFSDSNNIAFNAFSNVSTIQKNTIGLIPSSWNHYAMSSYNGLVKLYINGNLISSFVATPNNIGFVLNSNYLGKANNGIGTNITGSYREFRFWQVARSQTDLIYLKDFSALGTEDGLLIYLPLTNKNYIQKSTLRSNTLLENKSNTSSGNVVTNSVSDTSIYFDFDNTQITVEGFYSNLFDSANNVIQVAVNNLSNKALATISPALLRWRSLIAPSFRGGRVQASDTAKRLNFAPYYINTTPVSFSYNNQNRIFLQYGIADSLKVFQIKASFGETYQYRLDSTSSSVLNSKFSINSLNGTIRWNNANINGGNYILYVSVFNEFESAQVKIQVFAPFTVRTNIVGGTISPTNYPYYDSSLRISYQGLINYTLDSVLINGVNTKDSIKGYTITNINKDYDIVVKFTRYYNIQTNVQYGQISPSANIASSQSFRVTYANLTNYILDSVIVDGQLTNDSVSGYTFNNITNNHTIRVKYVPLYNIVRTIISAGNLVSDTIKVKSLTNYRLTYTAPASTPNYLIDSVIVDNIRVLDSSTGYTFYNISANHNVVIIYKAPISNFVIETQITNGNISPSVTVSQNSNYRITYGGNTNTVLDSVIVDGVLVTDSTTGYTFNNINKNHTIKVVYQPLYFITKTIKSDNNIVSQDTFKITKGMNYRVTYMPPASQPNYVVDTLLVDGVRIFDSTNGVTFYNVQNNFAIIIIYRSSYSTIPVITKITNGVISPSFNVLPTQSYRITYQSTDLALLDRILINGNSVTIDSINGYTLLNIREATTMEVFYKLAAVNTLSLGVINASCVGSANGSLRINTSSTDSFNLVLSSISNSSFSYNKIFNGNYQTPNNLDTGRYRACFQYVKNGNVISGSRCYEFTVTQPQPITGFSEVDHNGKIAVLNINRTSIMHFTLNGIAVEAKQISERAYQLELSSGINIIKVTSENACEGSYSDTIVVSSDMYLYPNPAAEQVTIYLGSASGKVEIDIINDQGNVYEKKIIERNDTKEISLSIRHLPNGVYLLKISAGSNSSTLKLIKN